MKRFLIPALLALGFSANASAQGPLGNAAALNNLGDTALLNNVNDSVANLAGNLEGTLTAASAGDITGTAKGLNATLTGLLVDLTANTPASPVGDLAVTAGGQLVVALEPVTSTLDGPAGQLLGEGGVVVPGVVGSLPVLPGLEGTGGQQPVLARLPGLPGDVNVPGLALLAGTLLPDLGALPVVPTLVPAVVSIAGVPVLPGT